MQALLKDGKGADSKLKLCIYKLQKICDIKVSHKIACT